MAGERIIEDAVVRIKPSFVGFRSALKKGVDEHSAAVNAVIGVTVSAAELSRNIRAAVRQVNREPHNVAIGVQVSNASVAALEAKIRALTRRRSTTIDVRTNTHTNTHTATQEAERALTRSRRLERDHQAALLHDVSRTEAARLAASKITYRNMRIARERQAFDRSAVSTPALERTAGSRFAGRGSAMALNDARQVEANFRQTQKEELLRQHAVAAQRFSTSRPGPEREVRRAEVEKIDDELALKDGAILKLNKEIEARNKANPPKYIVNLEERGGSRRGRLIASLIAALPLLQPIVAATTGAVGALTSSFIVAGAAAGAFAGAALGQFKQLSAVLKETHGVGLGAFAPVAAGLKTLKASYADFLTATREPVLGVFTTGLNAASTALPRFAPLANAAAGAVDGLVKRFGSFVTSGEFAQFLNFAEQRGPSAITSFGVILGNLGRAVLNTVQAFDPLSQITLGGLEGMTEKLAKTTANLGSNPAFQEFMKNVADRGPVVLHALGDLAGAFIHIGTAAGPIGNMMLKVVGAFSRLISGLPISLLTVLIGAFTTLRVTMIAAAAGAAVLRVSTAAVALTMGLARAASFAAATGNMALATSYREAAVAGTTAALSFTGVRAALVSTGVGALVVGVGVLIGWLLTLASTQKKTNETQQEAKRLGQDLADIYHKQGEAAAFAAAAESLFSDKTIGDRAAQYAALGGAAEDYSKAIAGNAEAQARADKVFEDSIPKTVRAQEALNEFYKSGDTDKFNKSMEQLGISTENGVGGAADFLKANKDNIKTDKELADSIRSNKNAMDASSAAVRQRVAVLQQLDRAMGRTAGNTEALTKATIQSSEAFTKFQNAQEALGATGYEKIITAVTDAYDQWQDSIRAVTAAQQNQKRVGQDTKRAEENAAKSIVDAQKGVVTAQKAVADSHKAVVDAQDRIKDAYQRVTEAQKSLTDAREDAKRKLRDQVDTEESMRIALAEAERQVLLTSGLASNNLDRRRALLDVKNAREDLSDFMADRNTGGVETDPAVIAAKKAVVDANKGVVDAQDTLAEANLRVRDAQDALKEAHNRVTEAYQNQTRAIEDGKTARADAAENTRQAIEQQGKHKKAYDNVVVAAKVAGVEIDLTAEKARSFQGEYGAKLTADSTDAVAHLKNVLQYVGALKLLSENPNLSNADAWNQAGKNLGRPEGLRPGAGTPGIGGRATGGPIVGAGTKTSDSIPGSQYRLSHGEHIWTADEVQAAGGHGVVKRIRNAVIGRAWGGPITGPNLKVNPGTADAVLNSGLIDKITAGFTKAFGGLAPLGDAGAAKGNVYHLANLKPWVLAAANLLGPMFGIKSIGGYATGGHAKNSDHYTGLALDLMTNNLGPPARGNPTGQRLADYVQANRGPLAVTYEIWNKQQLKTNGKSWVPYSGASDHTDHVHVSFRADGKGGGALIGGGQSTIGVGADNLKDLFLGRSASTVGGNLGAWMNEGVKWAGVPASWIGGKGVTGLYTLIMRESGGNPRSINLTDSNAARGDPSRGLMQTIGGTYNAYRDKRLVNDIYDPVSNITAGLNYIKSRYGTIFNVQQADPNRPPRGYREGGMVIADQGARLAPHSRTLVENRTGKWEEVGFPTGGMSRADKVELAMLIAQALQTRPAELYMDDEPIARTAQKSVAAALRLPGR